LMSSKPYIIAETKHHRPGQLGASRAPPSEDENCWVNTRQGEFASENGANGTTSGVEVHPPQRPEARRQAISTPPHTAKPKNAKATIAMATFLLLLKEDSSS